MKWFGRDATAPESEPLPADNKRTGQQGEEISAGFLAARGYRILERNFRCRGGRGGHHRPRSR